MLRKKMCLFLALCTVAMVIKRIYTKQPRCVNEEACETDPECLCYSSDECTFRKKNPATDRPTFIKDDPYGNYCYCKPSDYENYEKKRCKLYDNK